MWFESLRFCYFAKRWARTSLIYGILTWFIRAPGWYTPIFGFEMIMLLAWYSTGWLTIGLLSRKRQYQGFELTTFLSNVVNWYAIVGSRYSQVESNASSNRQKWFLNVSRQLVGYHIYIYSLSTITRNFVKRYIRDTFERYNCEFAIKRSTKRRTPNCAPRRNIIAHYVKKGREERKWKGIIYIYMYTKLWDTCSDEWRT